MSRHLVYVTTGSEPEAERIAAKLIEERLAACANILPGMRSVYRWQGRVTTDSECVLLLKTRADLVEAVTERVRALHSYDVPCVVSWALGGGNPAFLDWIGDETA